MQPPQRTARSGPPRYAPPVLSHYAVQALLSQHRKKRTLPASSGSSSITTCAIRRTWGAPKSGPVKRQPPGRRATSPRLDSESSPQSLALRIKDSQCSCVPVSRSAQQEPKGPITPMPARRSKRLPVVLTREEALVVIDHHLSGIHQMIAKIPCGSGLRLKEPTCRSPVARTWLSHWFLCSVAWALKSARPSPSSPSRPCWSCPPCPA